MKISLDWLQDFVDLTVTDPREIERRVTAGVAEVDDVEVQGAYLDGVVVGKVLTLARHPNADRLSVCTVKTDTGDKKIVCGGTNLRQGMRVALAHVGATVSDGKGGTFTLKSATIRGEPSEGMICAATELGLEERYPPKKEDGDRPVIDLGDGDDGVGKAMTDYLGLGDTVLHIDNHAITHRPDLFSQMGFAREFVALGLATWKKPKPAKKLTFPTTAPSFTVKVEDETLVPRYEAAVIEIGGLGETPDWMKRRLEATGWRSISLPIDITNYVLMETGMPHHGFDAGDFHGDLHIRRAKKGERITTLDGEDRVLPDGALVISDDDGIFDLFGIMGGMRTSTKEGTRRIFLQAGIPDPVSIRRTVIEMGHRTDAATVYEKGVPRVTAEIGLHRAIELFLELVPGARIASKKVSWGENGKPKDVALDLAYAERMLGTRIPEKRVTAILETLECVVKAPAAKAKTGTARTLKVTPPPHRTDLRGPHDLVEEIGRVFGYDAIEAQAPVAAAAPSPRDPRMGMLRESLREAGFAEILPVSLVGPSLLSRAGMDPAEAMAVQNPIGEELSLLHTSTLPSLLAHAERNLLHASGVMRTFHWGHVFRKGDAERAELSALVTRVEGSTGLGDEPLLLLKRDLAAAVDALGYELDVSPAGTPPPGAHPGRFGDLHLRPKRGEAGEPTVPSVKVGVLFEVHPDVRARFSMRHRAAAAVVDLETLLALSPVVRVPRPTPHFPAIAYDVTLPLSQREQAGSLLRRLREGDPLLEQVEVVDLFSDKQMPKGEYRLTLRFTYRAPDRTLTEEEAKSAHETLLRTMKVEVGS